MSNYLTPPIAIGYKSCCGNFSHTDIERIEGIDAVGTVFEKIFVLTKKVQMKRSVTGGETKAAAHKGTALVLRWLGARQRHYMERRIRRASASMQNIRSV